MIFEFQGSLESAHEHMCSALHSVDQCFSASDEFRLAIQMVQSPRRSLTHIIIN